MVKEGIVLGHKISKRAIEVDRSKIEVIEKLTPPVSISGIRSFLGHVVFYMRLMKELSKILNPLGNILENEVKFVFDNTCLKGFKCLKEQLVLEPIIVSPD